MGAMGIAQLLGIRRLAQPHFRGCRHIDPSVSQGLGERVWARTIQVVADDSGIEFRKLLFQWLGDLILKFGSELLLRFHLGVSVTVREGTTFSVRRVPARNQWVSADWCRPLVSHVFSQELT